MDTGGSSPAEEPTKAHASPTSPTEELTKLPAAAGNVQAVRQRRDMDEGGSISWATEEPEVTAPPASEENVQAAGKQLGTDSSSPTEDGRAKPLASTGDVQAARKELGMESGEIVNYAVVGRTAVGKSSLINGLRLLPDSHPDAAEVGDYETTTEIMKHVHPKYSHAVLWEIPGVGSSKYPEDTYFEDSKLFAFDCIMIVSIDRFHAIEYKIAEKATMYKVPFIFIRTQADVSCKSLALRMDMKMTEVAPIFKQTVAESFQKDLKMVPILQQFQDNRNLFIVSAWAFHQRRRPYTLFNSEDGTIDDTLNGMDEDLLDEFLANHKKIDLADP